jgi:hypothetical protein
MPAIPLLAVVIFLALPAPAAAGWRSPVPGPVTRAFDVGANPYEGGRHRGIDLGAAPGTPVRAACAGRVVVAGRVGTSGGVVTLLCGRWRVSHMPLNTITVRPDTNVSPGARLGTLADDHAHAGLHLGVRRAGTRFGYVDPLRFLSPTPTPLPPLGRAPRGRPRNLTPRSDSPPTPSPPPIAAPRPVSARRPVAAPRPVSVPGSGSLAPWPAWAGLALVLAELGVRWRGPLRTRTCRIARARVRLHE